MNYNNAIVTKDLEELLNNDLDFSEFKNKTFLVTGATGMLATYFIYFLMYLNDKKQYNIKIYGLVRNENKFKERFLINNERRLDIIPVVQDVCDKVNIDGDIDYIVHMASSANPKSILKDPTGIIKANIIGTFNILDLAKEKRAKVIFTSTREIYGKMPDNIEYISEEDMGILNCFESRSCYPESKRAAETILLSYNLQYGVEFQNLRIAHTYGPGMNINNDGRIMSDLISSIVSKKEIVLKSTGEAKRAFCYITDAISAILYVIIMGKSQQSYNISNETEEVTIKELAKILAEKYELNVKYDINENEKKLYTNFKRVGLNTNKLEKLGWKPTVKLEDGVNRTVESFK